MLLYLDVENSSRPGFESQVSQIQDTISDDDQLEQKLQKRLESGNKFQKNQPMLKLPLELTQSVGGHRLVEQFPGFSRKQFQAV